MSIASAVNDKMASINLALLVAALAVGFGSVTSALKSPCPGLFQYDSADQPNQWTGTLTLLSDADLQGVWVRLIFDEKLSELRVGGEFAEVIASENNEYLIKDRQLLLKGGVPTDVKITVRYEGGKVPKLIGYRLNARTVCNVNSGSRDVFPGDLNIKDFLASNKPVDYKEFSGCGTTPLANNRLVNGQDQNEQWPWQAAVYIQNNDADQYACEATLISPKHILTAGHCVTYGNTELLVPAQQFTIHLGNFRQDEVNKQVQKVGAEKIILYPGYRSENLFNDLAIIQLNQSVIINDHVRPICLRNSAQIKEGFLVGYEINRDRKLESLAQAKVKIVGEDECSTQHSDLKGLLTDNVICASYVDENSRCVGDSGSSLVAVREGPKPVWELNGVVTVGIALQNKECTRSNAAVVVNVANYVKWIQKVIS